MDFKNLENNNDFFNDQNNKQPDIPNNNQPEKIGFWKKNRKLKYVVISCSIILALAIFYWIGVSEENDDVIKDISQNSQSIPPTQEAITDTPSPSATISDSKVDGKTIDLANTQLTKKSAGYCSALAPSDWQIEAEQSGRGVDIYNADKTEGAGWFIAPILTELFGEPDQAIETIMRMAGNENYHFTSAGQEVDGGFIMRDFSAVNAGRNIKGTGLYKKYPIDGTGYVLSYYQAATTNEKWDSRGGLASEVAISIRCNAQITPSADDGFNTSTSVSDTSDKTSFSDSWSEKAILGQETVHSPSTGETYSVSTSSYSDTGLQGGDPGYYRTIDSNGSVERLESGYGNY